MMKHLTVINSWFFGLLVAGALLILTGATACTPGTGGVMPAAARSLNSRIDEAYSTASHIAFTGKVVDANDMWLDNYLVILFLNGKEIGRDTTRLQNFSESLVGPHNGLFKIRVNNVYELSAEDNFILNGTATNLNNGGGFVGNTKSIYRWFHDLEPGSIRRIYVPIKQIEYAIYVSTTAVTALPPEMVHGRMELTSTGEVRAVSQISTGSVPVATAVPQQQTQPAAASGQGISWSHRLTGFEGNRWEVWEQYIRGHVPGLSWEEFKEQVLVYNPDLVQDSFVFHGGKTYVLPEAR